MPIPFILGAAAILSAGVAKSLGLLDGYIKKLHEDQNLDVDIPDGKLSAEQVAQVCDSSFKILERIDYNIRKAKESADGAKKAADEASEMKVGIVFNRDCIEALQKYAKTSAEAQSKNVEALTLLFNYQKRMIQCCDKIRDMAKRNAEMLYGTVEFFSAKLYELKKAQLEQKANSTIQNGYLIENLNKMINDLNERKNLLDNMNDMRAEIDQLKRTVAEMKR